MGVEILKAGGNAVDAAVAVGFALAVTFPQAGNLGGGGFMLIRMASGDAIVVDYREQAPAAATRAMYLDAQGNVIPGASTIGARAAGVPGTVQGTGLGGREVWPSGVGARDGTGHSPGAEGLSRELFAGRALSFRARRSWRSLTAHAAFSCTMEISTSPARSSGSRTWPARSPPSPNAARRRSIPARLPRRWSRPCGNTTASSRARILKHYQAKLRPPLLGHFRGFDILSVPPPSAGGTMLIEMLNVLEPLDLGAANSYASIHLLAETMRRAYADRAAYLGDADFASVPVAGLTSPRYAAQLREEILGARPEAPVRPGAPQVFESGATTHFSVVDAEGNAVANTYTLNGWFGSGVTVEGAGFLLNNEMDDFTAKPGTPNLFGLVQSEANAIAPRKRPLSSMTPTIVTRDGKVRLVLGSPGGSTITNTVLQVLLNVLVYKMDVLQAVTSPRFHDQWTPDLLAFERVGFSSDTLEKVQQAGYPVSFRDSIGDCEAIEIAPESGWRFGASDPRAEGKAVGY